MSKDHPLYLASVTLKDGRHGTIYHVHNHGVAFAIELHPCRGIEDLETVYLADIAAVDYSPFEEEGFDKPIGPKQKWPKSNRLMNL